MPAPRENARPTNSRGSGALLQLYSENEPPRGMALSGAFGPLAVATLPLRVGCLYLVSEPSGMLPRTIPSSPFSG